MKKTQTNQEYRDLIDKVEIKTGLLKELIEKVDPNFVAQSVGSGTGHAKA